MGDNKISDAVASRFLESLIPVTESGCHIFGGGLNRKGYGHVKHKNKNYAAHRLAWILSGKDLPEGKWILHKCDTPCCCNPDHLFIGDNQSNVNDCVSKGRKFTKLTASNVREIRDGGMSDTQFGRKFGVNYKTVRLARLGITWNHCMREEYE